MRALALSAANELQNGSWWQDSPLTERLPSGWLVGATFCGKCGLEYQTRRAFGDWWIPGEYRADGLRTNETADERGQRLGRRCAVVALRDFAAQLGV